MLNMGYRVKQFYMKDKMHRIFLVNVNLLILKNWTLIDASDLKPKGKEHSYFCPEQMRV